MEVTMDGKVTIRSALGAAAMWATGCLSGAVALVALASPAMAQGAARDAAAEQFVQAHGRAILALLASNHSTTNPAFDSAVEQFIDVPRISRFVLGKYARTATPDQMTRFAATFRTYAESVYQKRLSEFGTAKLVASSSIIRRPGDVLVTTTVTLPGQSPNELVWRVLGDGAARKVVDVQVKGVWLSITQQQDFVSTIDNAGGKVDVLIAQLSNDARSGVIHKK